MSFDDLPDEFGKVASIGEGSPVRELLATRINFETGQHIFQQGSIRDHIWIGANEIVRPRFDWR